MKQASGEMYQLYVQKRWPAPDSPNEAITAAVRIMHEWHDRWSNAYKKFDPRGWSQESKNAFLRENSLKAYARWHVMREVLAHWKDFGVWFGNPYDRDDRGEVTIPSLPAGFEDLEALLMVVNKVNDMALEAERHPKNNPHGPGFRAIKQWLMDVAGVKEREEDGR